jgi:hypothetical protein
MSIILSADRRRVNSLSSRFGSKQKCCAESRVSTIAKPRPATEENEVAQGEEKVEVKEDPDRPGYIEMS